MQRVPLSQPHSPCLPAETAARVVLEMTPEMQQGSTYNVTCRVENAGSLQNLSVMLYRGHQILHTKTFSDDLGARPHDKLVTFNMTARRYHQGQNISCHAVLDLDLNGHRLVVEESSPSTSFRVYGELPHPCPGPLASCITPPPRVSLQPPVPSFSLCPSCSLMKAGDCPLAQGSRVTCLGSATYGEVGGNFLWVHIPFSLGGG